MKLRVYFHQSPCSAATEVYFVLEQPNGDRLLAEPMQLKFSPFNASVVNNPSLVFDYTAGREFFPALVQGLAEVGYRYESSDAGELKATKAHLKDAQEQLSQTRSMLQKAWDLLTTVRIEIK